MQTGLADPRRNRRLTRGSGPWAVVLCIGFILTMLLELGTVRLIKGTDGRWLATTAAATDGWFVVVVMIISLLSLIGGAIFIVLCGKEWLSGERLPLYQQVTGTDVIYMCAWLQAINISFLFAAQLLLPQPLFPKGSLGSLLSTASLQIAILAVALFQFHGRKEAIGFGRPRHLGKMLTVILILFLLIVFALDFLVTNPLAELLNLSLESEREKQIENEIISAKHSNIRNVLASVLVIGGLVPIAEEILFRGLIQTYLVRRWGAWLGIGFSSLWFALLHVDVALFVPLFLIGAALGFVRHRYQSLWGAILLHSLNNLMSMFVYFE